MGQPNPLAMSHIKHGVAEAHPRDRERYESARPSSLEHGGKVPPCAHTPDA